MNLGNDRTLTSKMLEKIPKNMRIGLAVIIPLVAYGAYKLSEKKIEKVDKMEENIKEAGSNACKGSG